MKPDLKAVLAAMKAQQRQADPSSKALPGKHAWDADGDCVACGINEHDTNGVAVCQGPPAVRAQPLEPSLSHAGVDGWVGWVLRSTTSGYQWARVCISAELLPFLVHGRIEPGDMRANVAAYIERDLLSDKLSDPTRWKP
jgi:hypothetical protein